MRVIPLVLASALAALPARAEVDVDVDVELVIAVDVSRSMTARELEIQRRGYAEAIVSEELMEAVRTGMRGQVAITYIEWAGSLSQRTIVDWTLIAGIDDARRFAARLTAHFDETLRRTSISGGIDFAADLFDGNGYRGFRRVIDISGDGPNNHGRPVAAARDAALARGIVINGLPLMTREGLGAQWHLDDLDAYYRDCVIGGPGAFVIPVLEWAQFPKAVRRKLVLELAGRQPVVQQASFHELMVEKYDCLIGEKIWEQLYDTWD